MVVGQPQLGTGTLCPRGGHRPGSGPSSRATPPPGQQRGRSRQPLPGPAAPPTCGVCRACLGPWSLPSPSPGPPPALPQARLPQRQRGSQPGCHPCRLCPWLPTALRTRRALPGPPWPQAFSDSSRWGSGSPSGPSPAWILTFRGCPAGRGRGRGSPRAHRRGPPGRPGLRPQGRERQCPAPAEGVPPRLRRRSPVQETHGAGDAACRPEEKRAPSLRASCGQREFSQSQPSLPLLAGQAAEDSPHPAWR